MLLFFIVSYTSIVIIQYFRVACHSFNPHGTVLPIW